MKCLEAQQLLALAPDGELTELQLAALEQHNVTCLACREFAQQQHKASGVLRRDTALVALPEIEAEVRAVRVRLSAKQPARLGKLAPVLWIGASLAAAAALVFAFLGSHLAPHPTTSPSAASALVNYIVPGDPDASTVVYVDQASGWLVVWASIPHDKQHG